MILSTLYLTNQTSVVKIINLNHGQRIFELQNWYPWVDYLPFQSTNARRTFSAFNRLRIAKSLKATFRKKKPRQPGGEVHVNEA